MGIEKFIPKFRKEKTAVPTLVPEQRENICVGILEKENPSMQDFYTFNKHIILLAAEPDKQYVKFKDEEAKVSVLITEGSIIVNGYPDLKYGSETQYQSLFYSHQKTKWNLPWPKPVDFQPVLITKNVNPSRKTSPTISFSPYFKIEAEQNQQEGEKQPEKAIVPKKDLRTIYAQVYKLYTDSKPPIAPANPNPSTV